MNVAFKSSTRNSILLSLSLVKVWMVLSLVAGTGASEALHGSFAQCSVENKVVRLPILAGNPCITCRCQRGKVYCTRQHCPAECPGTFEHVDGQCCPSCIVPYTRPKPIAAQDDSACLYQNRKHKNEAKWFEPGCKVCRCTNGTVTCEQQRCRANLNCPRGHKPGLIPGACCLQCVEVTGVCTSYGEPHYQTFDGKMFNFQGNCKYRMAADCRHGNFSVRLRNERHYSRSMTWTKSLTIHIGATVVHLQRGLKVRVNRSDVELPYINLPHLQIDKKNFMVAVLTDIGIEVLWDGDSYIEIHVPNRFRGRMCGLCGNFNGVSTDDFIMKNTRVARDANEFGESWAVGRRRNDCSVRAHAPPVDAAVSRCRRSALHHWRARKRCWPIKSQFANCHKTVRPHKYYRSCITDVCTCLVKRCECESLMAYARACRRMGVDVDWGRKKACGITCKGGTVFDDCAPSCPKTCANKDTPSVCASQHCVPGCRCPAGQVLENNRCIMAWMCPPPISVLQERSIKRKT